MKLKPLLFAILSLALLAALSTLNAMELPADCWQALKGLKQSNHQYYDIPAWNCNGSLLLIVGLDQSAGKKLVRQSFLVAKLGTSERQLANLVNTQQGEQNTSRQWDAKNPDILYYSMLGSTRSTTVLRRHNVRTGLDEVLATVPVELTLAVPHPDGEHLLLVPRVGGTADVLIFSLSDRKMTPVHLPAAVHRVRFTKHPDLSVFCNTQTDETETRDARVSFLLNPATGAQQTLIKGQAGHPDWSPDGERLSFFNQDGLCIMDRQGKIVQRIPGLDGHQSWSPDGRFIVFDGGVYRVKDSRGVEKQFRNYISMVEPASGKITPVIPHQTKKAKSQDTHAHPVFSPDATKVVFNSNNRGKESPQAYVAKTRDPDPVKDLSLAREGNSIRVSWTPPQARETKSFVIYRIESRDQASVLAEVPLDSRSYIDTGAPKVNGYGVAVKEFSGLQSPVAKTYLQ